jgi:hypothetical protein
MGNKNQPANSRALRYYFLGVRRREEVQQLGNRAVCRARFAGSGSHLLVEARDRRVHVAARRAVAEEMADLLHLGDPAIGLGRHPRHLPRQPGQELRLAHLEFLMQRRRRTGMRGAEDHRHRHGGEPLGDAAIGHLQRRRRADRPVEGGERDTEFAEPRHLVRRRARHIDAGRGMAGRRRQPDDAAVHIAAAGAFQHRADLDRGFRRDGVAVDIDRLVARPRQRRLHPPREPDRFAGRADRQEEVGLADQRVVGGDRHHAGTFGPRRARRRAAGERGRHPHPALGEPRSHRRTHIARRNDRNHISHVQTSLFGMPRRHEIAQRRLRLPGDSRRVSFNASATNYPVPRPALDSFRREQTGT